jgi:hypothetical protein
MAWWEDRICNGLAKAGGGSLTQPDVERILAHDITIYADSRRATENDLWPGIWALAATLSRQFTGTIYLATGLDKPLPGPGPLSSRCVFTDRPPACRLALGLGQAPVSGSDVSLWGDARGNTLAFGHDLPGEAASPISAFAVAGYLSFALMASAAGFAPHKERFCQHTLEMDPVNVSAVAMDGKELAILGLGHLGNAYLALLYFMVQRQGYWPRLFLLDRGKDGGRLEKANWKTHVLLDESVAWEGSLKTEVISAHLKALGLSADTDSQTLNWGWNKPTTHPQLALMGFDSFDARRMAVAGGYEWLVDAGIGVRFDCPRITWHSLPPDNHLAKRLFSEGTASENLEIPANSLLAKSLDDPRDPCGWVRSFHGISAATPSMGIVAAAYAWSEVLKVWAGERRPMRGSAYLWSPGIPPSIEHI